MIDLSILTISDWIEVCAIVVSLLLGLSSIIVSVISVRQTSKMYEATTRPCIQIYPRYTDGILYIIIKNFGTSEAYIDDIECSHKFTAKETLDDDLGKNIFDSLKNSLLCPGYSIRCPLIATEVADETFDFYIKYHSSVKKYSGKFSFTPSSNSPFADLYPSPKTAEEGLKSISRELRDIVKSQL